MESEKLSFSCFIKGTDCGIKLKNKDKNRPI